MKKGRCLICNKEEHQIVGQLKYDYLKRFNADFNLAKCPDCEFYYLNPLPGDDELSEIYDEEYHYDKRNWLFAIIKFFSEFSLKRDAALIKRYKSNGSLVDIGGGTGWFLNCFSSMWDRYYVDPFSKVTGLPKDVKIFNKFLEDCRFENDFFDVVVLRNVLEHTSNPYPLLKEIKRILKKDGILFIRIPNIKSFDFKVFKEHWYLVQSPGHISFYSPNSIKELLKKIDINVQFLKTTTFSAPLSFFRSYNFKRQSNRGSFNSFFVPFLFFFSLVYSIGSLIYAVGKGGEIKLICSKRY